MMEPFVTMGLVLKETRYREAERGVESHIRNVYEIQCMKKIKFNEDEYAKWRSSYDTQFVIMEYQGPYKTRIVKLIN